jgi:caa(3)-type oxidase subunit IV
MDGIAHESLYRKTWLTLTGLALGSVVLSKLGLSQHALVALIFLVALSKALLVLKNFMHFGKREWIAALSLASPLILLAIMLGLMFIDFVGVKSGAEMLAQ